MILVLVYETSKKGSLGISKITSKSKEIQLPRDGDNMASRDQCHQSVCLRRKMWDLGMLPCSTSML